jgi:hypothetical protein
MDEGREGDKKARGERAEGGSVCATVWGIADPGEEIRSSWREGRRVSANQLFFQPSWAIEIARNDTCRPFQGRIN